METQANTLNSPILSSAPTTETLDMSTLNLSDKVDESEEKGTETEDFGKDDSNDDIEDEHECKLYCMVIRVTFNMKNQRFRSTSCNLCIL